MGILAVDEVMLRAPNLLVPKKNPCVRWVPNLAHPLISRAFTCPLLGHGNEFPHDLPGRPRWLEEGARATFGAQTAGNYAGALCILPADSLDETRAVFYTTTGRSGNVPLFICLSFAVMAAPTAANKGVMTIAGSATSGTPEVLFRSNSTTTMGLFISGADRYTGIPVAVGKWQRLALTYNGAVWKFWSSEKAPATYSGATSGQQTNIYLGSGYNAQLPCAFDQLIAGNTCPPDALIESWLADPWQIALPA